MKIVDYFESNKQIGRVSVFRGSVWNSANFKEELLDLREALINIGKMSVKEHKVKNACE